MTWTDYNLITQYHIRYKKYESYMEKKKFLQKNLSWIGIV